MTTIGCNYVLLCASPNHVSGVGINSTDSGWWRFKWWHLEIPRMSQYVKSLHYQWDAPLCVYIIQLAFVYVDMGLYIYIYGSASQKRKQSLQFIKSPRSQQATWTMIPGRIEATLRDSSIITLLVGGWALPLWKIWVRQLGWWHSQYIYIYIYSIYVYIYIYGKLKISQTTNQIIIISQLPLLSSIISNGYN